MQIDNFCLGAKIWLKNVWIIYLEKFSRANIKVFYAWIKWNDIHLYLILTKCLEIFCFWKMFGFSSKNIRELGSQVPNFLNVCSHSPFQGPWWSRRVPWALVDFQNDQNIFSGGPLSTSSMVWRWGLIFLVPNSFTQDFYGPNFFQPIFFLQNFSD